ncbi:MAG: carbohydrate ABC transporter permease [Streptomyces sp.]|uniref:carbohydrate ABC transporter permease n=1 Tax=Streptomyces sp. TaxID=1931 RepID=UPI003D6B5CDA
MTVTTTYTGTAGEAEPRGEPAGGRGTRRPLSLGRVLAWAAIALITLVTLFPFYWMLRTAFSTNTALATAPASPLPVDFTLGGFLRVFGLQSTEEALAEGGSGGSLDFWRYLANSVLVSTLVTFCQVFFAAMAAYAFARLRWRGRDAVFGFVLGGLMIPAVFTLLPNFVLIKEAGLVDSLFGITMPMVFMTMPFAVFFLRQFFLNISSEVEEAALIDGAGRIRVFFRLILPMSTAPIATLGILTYITAWNEYFWPLMVSYSGSSRVLTVALSIFRAQTPQTGTDWAGLMAATLVAALPMVLLFALLAKRIVNSIGFSGIK